LLLLGVPGWAVAAGTSQLTAATALSIPVEVSQAVAGKPYLAPLQSVSLLAATGGRNSARHLLHPRAALLKMSRGRLCLRRLTEQDEAFPQHQHRRFGMEAAGLRSQASPVTVARLRGLQEEFSSASIFQPSGRAPPTL